MGLILTDSAVNLELMKARLDIDSDDDRYDAVLTVLLAGAKTQADQYCAGYVFDDPIPADVEAWIIGQVARLWEQVENGATTVAITSVQQISWGPMDYTLLAPYRSYWGV